MWRSYLVRPNMSQLFHAFAYVWDINETLNLNKDQGQYTSIMNWHKHWLNVPWSKQVFSYNISFSQDYLVERWSSTQEDKTKTWVMEPITSRIPSTFLLSQKQKQKQLSSYFSPSSNYKTFLLKAFPAKTVRLFLVCIVRLFSWVFS